VLLSFVQWPCVSRVGVTQEGTRLPAPPSWMAYSWACRGGLDKAQPRVEWEDAITLSCSVLCKHGGVHWSKGGVYSYSNWLPGMNAHSPAADAYCTSQHIGAVPAIAIVQFMVSAGGYTTSRPRARRRRSRGSKG